MTTRLQRNDLEKAACVLRRIWLRRNKFVFEGKFDSPKSVILGPKVELEGFQQAQEMTQASIQHESLVNKAIKQKKPGININKGNWDIVLDLNNAKIGAGWIIVRNWEGEMVASLCMPKKLINDPVMAEIVALDRAMELSLEIGLEHVIFEGDALAVIKDVQNIEECQFWQGQIIEEITASFQGRQVVGVSSIYKEKAIKQHTRWQSWHCNELLWQSWQWLVMRNCCGQKKVQV